MQANEMKSMYAADGFTANGLVQIHPTAEFAPGSGYEPMAMDDTGLTFLIDGKQNAEIGCNLNDEYFISGYLTPETNVDSIGECESCSNSVSNRSPDGNVNFFESNIQSYPTPSCTPPQKERTSYNQHFLVKSIGMERQTSLSVALEVLGQLPLNQLYPPTPSPSDIQDELCVEHPSPSYVDNSTPLPQDSRDRTMCDHVAYSTFESDNSRLRTYCAGNASSLFDGGFSFTSSINDAATDTDTSDKENHDDDEKASCSNPSSSSTVHASTLCASNEVKNDVPGLSSLPSFLFRASEHPASIDPTPVDESLDMEGMLEEFLHNSEAAIKKHEENIKQLREIVDSDHCYCFKNTTVASTSVESNLSKRAPPTTPVSIVVDLTEEGTSSSASTPRMERSPSYIKKRNQNNRACRESRRKRKMERDEAEMKVKTFTVENEEMRNKIVQLEKEIKETRALLIGRMTSQP